MDINIQAELEVASIDIQFPRSWPIIVETTDFRFLLVRNSHTLPNSFGWVQDELPVGQAAVLVSIQQMDADPSEFGKFA